MSRFTYHYFYFLLSTENVLSSGYWQIANPFSWAYNRIHLKIKWVVLSFCASRLDSNFTCMQIDYSSNEITFLRLNQKNKLILLINWLPTTWTLMHIERLIKQHYSWIIFFLIFCIENTLRPVCYKIICF